MYRNYILPSLLCVDVLACRNYSVSTLIIYYYNIRSYIVFIFICESTIFFVNVETFPS